MGAGAGKAAQCIRATSASSYRELTKRLSVDTYTEDQLAEQRTIRLFGEFLDTTKPALLSGLVQINSVCET